MTQLPLRLRVFLFFCLIAASSVAVVWGGLWLGFRQLGDPGAASPFITVAILSAFGLPALALLIWLLFDTHVSKPIEAIAARLRLGAHGPDEGGEARVDARYLGDLAPAAAAMHETLSTVSSDVAETVEARTLRLKHHRDQLLSLLSDIPTATLMIGRDHNVVLYDGQAAALMAREAPVRLNGHVFDYLNEGPVKEALRQIGHDGRRPIAVTGRSGAVYSGHIRLFENGCYALMLDPLDADAARPLAYDFDLLDKAPVDASESLGLRDLCFVAFDTETTGLDPEKDDVVQIGAVRIVNARMVPGEAFDRLVNPGRPIPKASTAVHGIDDAMVADAPDFGAVCTDFAGFSANAVFLAHNAPFDMAFLHREGARAGLTFDHPVVDTVHMSAIVFGGSAEHTLDALCDRLAITIPPERRHTAMGDAIATAEAFLAMLPILEARGIETLGALRAESRRHRRILETA